MTDPSRSSPGETGSARSSSLPHREVLTYRALGILAAVIIVALGIAHRAVDAATVDPLWERAVVAIAALAGSGLAFVYGGRPLRWVAYGIFTLITVWVLHLLYLNEMSVDYALSVFLVVSATSALFRSSEALGAYLALTVLGVAGVAAMVPAPATVRTSPALYAVDVAIVCFLLYLIMQARLESEAALRNTEHYYRALIENTEDSIMVLDDGFAAKYASPSSAGLFGYGSEELARQPLPSLVHPADRDGVLERLERVATQSGGTADLRFRIVRKDEAMRHVRSAFQNLRSVPGVEGIVANARDITQPVQLEQELRRSQKMEALGRLAGGVAHDFKNLLTAISGQTELVLAELPEGSPVRSDAEEIRRVVDRAGRVTRQLLAVGKREAMDPTIFDLGSRITELERMLEGLTGDLVELRIRVEDGPLPVEADPSQIERVVVNLVLNARDAMPNGGRIDVEVASSPRPNTLRDMRSASGGAQNVQDAPSEVPSDVDGYPGYCVLSVSDRGIGIPQELLEQIFEPFYTTKDTGTGLGLATVYGLVEQSGGEIEVESEVGVGTTSRVYLPRAETLSA